MAWRPDNDRQTPARGLPEPTGYRRAPQATPSEQWTPPNLRKRASAFEVAKFAAGVTGVVLTIGAIIFKGGQVVEKVDRMYEEQRMTRSREEQRETDMRALKDTVAKAESAQVARVEENAAAIKHINDVLRRISITSRRPPPAQ